MNRHTLLRTGSMLKTFFLGGVLFVSIPLSAQKPVSVSGRILADEATRARVIRVALTAPAAAQPLTELVDSDGTFEFSRVMPGSYSLIAYASTSVSEPITLKVETADVTGLTIRLPDPKGITGRVIVQGNLPSSVPIPRIVIALAPLPGIPSSSATVPANPLPDGSFRVALPQGDRQVSLTAGAIPPGYKVASFTYGPTDLLQSPIRVASGDTAELRITLDATAIMPVKVSGRVDNLITTRGVRVVLTNPTFGSFEASITADGSFVLPKVIPGNYVARLSLSGLAVASPVTIGDRDVSNVLLTYPRQFIAGGHVIVEGGAPASGDIPEVTLEARQTQNGSDMTRSASLNTGVILLNVKDGEYNVSVKTLPPGYQLKSIMYGTTDLQKAPLKIDGPVTWEIIVRLTPSAR